MSTNGSRARDILARWTERRNNCFESSVNGTDARSGTASAGAGGINDLFIVFEPVAGARQHTRDAAADLIEVSELDGLAEAAPTLPAYLLFDGERHFVGDAWYAALRTGDLIAVAYGHTGDAGGYAFGPDWHPYPRGDEERDAAARLRRAVAEKDDADCNIEFEGAAGVLLPDARYPALLIDDKTMVHFGTPRLYLDFCITSGEYKDTRLSAIFAITRLSERGIVAARGGKLYRTMTRLLGKRLRNDQMSLRSLRGRILEVQTRTVGKDRDKKELPPSRRYSVISELMRFCDEQS